MTDTKPTVGWIGAGRMGFQLAKRLLAAGYDVAVYNRTRAKAEPLTEFGASIVDRPAVGSRYPINSRSSVVLPAPLGPSRPRISPCGSSNVHSFNAATRP